MGWKLRVKVLLNYATFRSIRAHNPDFGMRVVIRIVSGEGGEAKVINWYLKGEVKYAVAAVIEEELRNKPRSGLEVRPAPPVLKVSDIFEGYVESLNLVAQDYRPLWVRPWRCEFS